MILAKTRAYVVFMLLAGYLVLGYSFMLLPGGTAIPIGEIVLFLSLLGINYFRVFPRLNFVATLTPFVIWWGLGLVRAVSGYAEYGLWALRDANQVIESLYLIVGFVVAGNPKILHSLFRFIPIVLFIYVVYSLGYPLRDPLQDYMKAWSLYVVGGSGQIVPLVFSYTEEMAGIVLLWAAVYLVIFHGGRRTVNWIALVLAGVIALYAIMISQARTTYIQAVILFVIFLIYKRSSLHRFIAITPVLVLIGLLFVLSGIKITGRLGHEISISFLVDHFILIFDAESSNLDLEGPASGVPQRLGWWTDILDRLTSDPVNLLFGLGYGFPLVDFGYYGGIVVREPHNSFISILARLGVVGSVAWIWMHTLLLAVWSRSMAFCRRAGWTELWNWLFLFLTFFAMVWALCVGEDGLEKSYVAIPYYFFWGVVLRIGYYCKTAAASLLRQAGDAGIPTLAGQS